MHRVLEPPMITLSDMERNFYICLQNRAIIATIAVSSHCTVNFDNPTRRGTRMNVAGLHRHPRLLRIVPTSRLSDRTTSHCSLLLNYIHCWVTFVCWAGPKQMQRPNHEKSIKSFWPYSARQTALMGQFDCLPCY